VLAGIGFGFHHQRRAELRTTAQYVDSTAERIDHAYDAAVCFAMVVLILVSGLSAGLAGYTFFSPPGHGDVVRDVAGGQALTYGGLALAAWLIFRARFWAIRGGRPDREIDDNLDDPRVAEVEDLA
jgi:hypothetical protein